MTEFPNWFNVTARVHFELFLKEYAGQPDLRFLQLGAFTGDATQWLLDNIVTHPSSLLIDVDTWQGSSEHEGFDWEQVEAEYLKVYNAYGLVDRYKMTTHDFFRTGVGQGFNFIYVDAAHTAINVMEDAVNSYRILKPGGILAFDDYTWQHPDGHVLDAPGIAIDMVKYLYAGRLQLMGLDSQAWFRKVG